MSRVAKPRRGSTRQSCIAGDAGRTAGRSALRAAVEPDVSVANLGRVGAYPGEVGMGADARIEVELPVVPGAGHDFTGYLAASRWSLPARAVPLVTKP